MGHNASSSKNTQNRTTTTAGRCAATHSETQRTDGKQQQADAQQHTRKPKGQTANKTGRKKQEQENKRQEKQAQGEKARKQITNEKQTNNKTRKQDRRTVIRHNKQKRKPHPTRAQPNSTQQQAEEMQLAQKATVRCRNLDVFILCAPLTPRRPIIVVRFQHLRYNTHFHSTLSLSLRLQSSTHQITGFSPATQGQSSHGATSTTNKACKVRMVLSENGSSRRRSFCYLFPWLADWPAVLADWTCPLCKSNSLVLVKHREQLAASGEACCLSLRSAHPDDVWIGCHEHRRQATSKTLEDWDKFSVGIGGPVTQASLVNLKIGIWTGLTGHGQVWVNVLSHAWRFICVGGRV